MKRTLLLLLLSVITSTIFSQAKVDFRSPLDIPLILSGNFGELRSDHFHSGIDIKTQGVTGHKVFAVDSGYVSRIKVQAGGYGKAIYINHPSGYTTVYGHLSEYNSRIGKYVRDLQYKKESHSVDIYLKPGDIKIRKGELIALSGNSGSSAGPHLHFEIRKANYQIPVNALFFKLPIKDDIPPVFKKLAIYPLDEKAEINNSNVAIQLDLTTENDTFRIANKKEIKAFGNIGVGVEIYDYLNGSRNRCGIFSLELILDGTSYFYSEMDAVSFSESRFINAHIDYEQKVKNNLSIQGLYKLPYNELSIYKQLKNNGFMKIKDTLLHELIIRSKDSYGNTSILALNIKGSGTPQLMKIQERFEGTVLPYNAQSGFSDKDIQLTFPAYCFYEDVNFNFTRTNGRDDIISDVFHIHNEYTPVHKKFKIALTPHKIPEGREDKVCLVAVGDEELSYAGGTFENGKVIGETRNFGKYAVAIDTIKPTITALNMHPGKDMSGINGMRFIIEDELSGIGEYQGYIDNQWVLFEYDPKNDLLIYEFDSKVPISKKNHELEIRLSDALGNLRVYHTSFQR